VLGENCSFATIGLGVQQSEAVDMFPSGRSLKLRPSAIVGLRRQPVSALKPFGIDQIAARGSVVGRGWLSQKGEESDNHQRIFDALSRPKGRR